MQEAFQHLYEAAKAVLRPRELSSDAYAGSVAAALQSESGTVYTGVCIDTGCSMGFCAEHAAAAAMVTAGESRITRILAIYQDGSVIPPCGRCREFLLQLNDDNGAALVLVDEETVVPLQQLLPYRRA